MLLLLLRLYQLCHGGAWSCELGIIMCTGDDWLRLVLEMTRLHDGVTTPPLVPLFFSYSSTFYLTICPYETFTAIFIQRSTLCESTLLQSSSIQNSKKRDVLLLKKWVFPQWRIRSQRVSHANVSMSKSVYCCWWIPCIQVSYLVMVDIAWMCAWRWYSHASLREGGLSEKRRDYLPNDKQFLVTRNG